MVRLSHLIVVGKKEEQVNLKIDSKGRFCIPAEIREEICDTVTLKKTPEGYLIVPGKRKDFLVEFKKVIISKHRRTGKPECWSPEKMKSIWSKIE
jgi:bifunctional DNA-binding transcriptional regulator/antitoxin component of YhaV-PrlF toxin-antitoxin module